MKIEREVFLAAALATCAACTSCSRGEDAKPDPASNPANAAPNNPASTNKTNVPGPRVVATTSTPVPLTSHTSNLIPGAIGGGGTPVSAGADGGGGGPKTFGPPGIKPNSTSPTKEGGGTVPPTKEW